MKEKSPGEETGKDKGSSRSELADQEVVTPEEFECEQAGRKAPGDPLRTTIILKKRSWMTVFPKEKQ